MTIAREPSAPPRTWLSRRPPAPPPSSVAATRRHPRPRRCATCTGVSTLLSAPRPTCAGVLRLRRRRRGVGALVGLTGCGVPRHDGPMPRPCTPPRSVASTVARRLVFCHGLFGQGRNWTGVAKALADEHRCAAGRPAPPRPVAVARAGRLPRRRRPGRRGCCSADEPVTLVGHSMGGKVAMVLALRHPELVDAARASSTSRRSTTAAAREFAAYVDGDAGSRPRRARAPQRRRRGADRRRARQRTVRDFLLQNLRRDGDSWRWQVNLEVLGASLDDDQRLARRPARRPAGVRRAGAVARGLGVALRAARARRGDAARCSRTHRRVTVKGAGHWVHSRAARGVRRGAAAVHRPLRAAP